MTNGAKLSIMGGMKTGPAVGSAFREPRGEEGQREMSKIPSVNPEEEDAIARIDSVPPPGDEDVYNAGTIVRDAPSDLVEVSRRSSELAAGAGKPKPPPPRPHSMRSSGSANKVPSLSPLNERGNQEETPPRGTASPDGAPFARDEAGRPILDLATHKSSAEQIDGGVFVDDPGMGGYAEQVAPNVEERPQPSFLASMGPNKTMSIALVVASVLFGIAAIAVHPSLSIAAGGLLLLAVVLFSRQQ